MVKRLRVQITAPAGTRGYGCALCGTHLCLETDIMSRHFHGRHGRALLVDRCENFYFGAQELKELMTGRHLVRDVFCAGCDKNIGWCYDFANDESERYKIHRFVLEQKLIRTITTNPLEGGLAVSAE